MSRLLKIYVCGLFVKKKKKIFVNNSIICYWFKRPLAIAGHLLSLRTANLWVNSLTKFQFRFMRSIKIWNLEMLIYISCKLLHKMYPSMAQLSLDAYQKELHKLVPLRPCLSFISLALLPVPQSSCHGFRRKYVFIIGVYKSTQTHTYTYIFTFIRWYLGMNAIELQSASKIL